tara:strand:- start:5408 stop:5746 length:339 start_codon:yes stop_codon:yes gene_type:complete
MKSQTFKSLIKEAVKEAIQEELKEILLEAVKAPKQSFITQPVSETLPKSSPQISENRREKYANILGETAASFNTSNIGQPLQVTSTDTTSPNGQLPQGEVGMDQIMGLLNSK